MVFVLKEAADYIYSQVYATSRSGNNNFKKHIHDKTTDNNQNDNIHVYILRRVWC